jgi:hypothetical protein
MDFIEICDEMQGKVVGRFLGFGRVVDEVQSGCYLTGRLRLLAVFLGPSPG